MTKAFWKWFGDSKIVDDNGDPLVVYHGTNKKFSKFSLRDTAQGIIWFSSDRDKIERGDSGATGRQFIMELYAKIERPAGWREYEKMMLGQIRQDYDGVILDDDNGEFDGFVFKPTQLRLA